MESSWGPQKFVKSQDLFHIIALFSKNLVTIDKCGK